MKFLPLLVILLISCSSKKHIYSEAISKNKIKLCMIGDTGTRYPIQKQVAQMLNAEACDTTHFLGDIIYPDGLNSPRDKNFKRKFYDYYENLGKKYLVMGNHDHRSSVNAWITIAQKHHDIFFPNPYYLLKINSLCLVHIDTNYYKLFLKFGTGVSQYRWINSLSGELKSCSKKVVLAHHPFESRGPHGPSSGLLRQFLKKNIIGKFDAFIAGHDHILSDEGTVDGTRLFISGAGGKPDEKEPAGYLVLNWDQVRKEMNFEFRKLP